MALKLTCYIVTIMVTYYLASFLQASFHVLFGHKTIGRALYRNHIYHHHAIYSKGRMASEKYIAEEKSNTPYYILPAALTAWAGYRVLPFDIFLVHTFSMASFFWAHVHLHAQYHLRNSWLSKFRWFRKKQQLHFLHHQHSSKNYAVIEPLWDKVFGTYLGVHAER